MNRIKGHIHMFVDELTHRKLDRNMKSTVLLPLYVYPHPGAWDPLYAA
jgi:hypothetical protein